MAGEYINSKAGKKRIKKEWKNREKKDELHTFKDTTEMALLYRVKKELSTCKYFSQEFLLLNSFIINVLQNLLFCIVKAAVLHGKSVGFALQKSRFRNAKSKLPFFKEIIFTKQWVFLAKAIRL